MNDDGKIGMELGVDSETTQQVKWRRWDYSFRWSTFDLNDNYLSTDYAMALDHYRHLNSVQLRVDRKGYSNSKK